MGNPRLAIAEFLLALGRPGAFGGLLLLAVAAYALGMLLPGQRSVDALEERAARAERRAGAAPAAPAPVAGLPAASPAQAFYAGLPATPDLEQQVARIYAAAAAEQLALLQGEYARSEIAGTQLVRYRITLPMRGSYAQVRRFIAAAGTAVPGLVLDDLDLQRRTVGDSQVEARVQLSLFLARP
jgi:hypothetical protein